MDEKYLRKVAYTGETLQETEKRILARRKRLPKVFTKKSTRSIIINYN